MAHQVIIQLCASFGVYLGVVGFGVVGSLIGYATQRSSLSPGQVAAIASAGTAVFCALIWIPVIYYIVAQHRDFIRGIKYLVKAPYRSLRWIPLVIAYEALVFLSGSIGNAMLYDSMLDSAQSADSWETDKCALIGGVIVAALFYLVGVVLDYGGYGAATLPVNPALPPPLPATIPPPPVTTPAFTYPPSHQLGR